MAVPVASGPGDGDPSGEPDAERDPAPALAAVAASQGAAAVDLTVAGQFAAATAQVAAALSFLANPGSASGPDGGAESEPSRTPGPDAAAGIPGTVRTTADGGREVVVKLDPEHLGSVSIRLKMTGGKVDIAITVSDAHTLDVLTRDRHVLSAAVGSAGLGEDGLVLSRQPSAEPAPSPSSPDGGAGGGSGRSPDGSASASSDPSGNRRRDARNPAPSSASADAGSDEPQPVEAAQRSGALYV